jgi:hypothetical protein
MIHGRFADIERETRHRRVHEDAKVVAEVGARDAEGVHGCQDEGVSREEERDCGVFDERGGEGGVGRLGREGFVVSVLWGLGWWSCWERGAGNVQEVSEDT